MNAVAEIKSMLSKHIADNPRTSDSSNEEKCENFEIRSGHGNISNVSKSKIDKSPLKRDSKGPVKHIDKKTMREQVFTKTIDELEVKLNKTA